MEKGKGNKKPEKNGGKIVRVIIALALLFVLLTAITLAAIAHFSGSESEESRSTAFALAHKGKKYDQDARGVELLSGDEISVYLTGEAESYKVEVVAYINEENEIQFKIGNEPFKWSETADKTFTGGFTFTQTKGGFKIEYNSITEIISAAYGGREVTIDEKAASGIDLFKLTVTYGKESVSLTFAVGVPIEGIEIKPGEIVISETKSEGENKYD